MSRKVFYFLLFTLFAVSCMACNLSADTTKTSQKADNPLIEDGYDVDADTVRFLRNAPSKLKLLGVTVKVSLTISLRIRL